MRGRDPVQSKGDADDLRDPPQRQSGLTAGRACVAVSRRARRQRQGARGKVRLHRSLASERSVRLRASCSVELGRLQPPTAHDGLRDGVEPGGGLGHLDLAVKALRGVLVADSHGAWNTTARFVRPRRRWGRFDRARLNVRSRERTGELDDPGGLKVLAVVGHLEHHSRPAGAEHVLTVLI